MYRTKLRLVLGAFVCFVLALTAMLYWGAQRAAYFVDRSHFAHQQLAAYERLSIDTYSHFKQVVDLVLLGDQANAVNVAATQDRLNATLGELRRQTEMDIAGIEEDELRKEEELELLAIGRIEGEIERARQEFLDARDGVRAGTLHDAWRVLSNLFDTRVDSQLMVLIDEAIEDEETEALSMEAETTRILSRLRLAGEAVAGLALVFGVAAGSMLVGRLRAPIDRLLAGSRHLSTGDLGYRIDIAGKDEFAQLADGFNHMAGELQAKQQALLGAQETLEAKVKERSEQLRQANDALRRTDRTRQRFLADIGHELRTPLTIIRGEAEVTLRDLERSGGEGRTPLARIVEQTEQLGRLVDDLLFIARSQAGELRLDLAPTPLPALLAKIRETATILSRETGVDLVLTRSEGEAVVSGDPHRLTQLFLILLDNAFKYSEPGTGIAIEVAEEHDAAVVSVSDQGGGIAPEELDQVFDRYFRGREARRVSPDGSGLGLPLAKAIAEGHDGEISIASTPGKGTRVTVRLPLCRDGEAAS